MFTLLFATGFVFAGNIGRAVYGVLTETYNGASTNASAGDDKIFIYGNILNDTDKIEGQYSNSIGIGAWLGVYFNSGGEWGMNPQNMTAYTGGRLYFSAKVPTTIDITTSGNVFKISDGVDKVVPFNSTNIKRIDNGAEILDTKIKNDNAWHTYYIELDSFTGLQLANITYLFVVGCSASNDAAILIDNVYWAKAKTEPRSFTVTVKNLSDHQTTTDQIITWSQSCFRQSWIAANQYIELDLDQESSNWFVRVYLDNGKAARDGLYCVDSDDSEIVLPMAWRIRPDILPNGIDTLDIAVYNVYPDYGLYDVGRNPGGSEWYTWCPMRELKAGIDYDDVKVWTLRGLHTVVWKHDSYDPLTTYIERKPKIYFAADCSNALAGLTYTANVITELVYE